MKRTLLLTLCLIGLMGLTPTAQSQEASEYQLKAAFLYNFALFTDWPKDGPKAITLCLFGEDPFGEALNQLGGKMIGQRMLAIQRKQGNDPLQACQIVFIAPAAIKRLPRVLETLRDAPVLTVADSPDAAQSGVMLNMAVVQGKIRFTANLRAAQAARLRINSQLLRLATEVIQ